MTVRNLETAPSARLFNNDPVATLSDTEIGARLEGYASQIAALTARFLELLAEFDARGAWSGAGVLSCAHWLCWRTGMNMRTAQEHVRIARALTELPSIRAAFANGQLTYSKVRALTRVATPEREPELLNIAISATASQVERVVRALRQVERTNEECDSEPVEMESTGRWRWNYDGSLSVTLRLTALDGAAFLAAVVRAEYERNRTESDPSVPRNAQPAESDPPKRSRDLWRHVPADIAPAVVTMADTVRSVIDIPAVAPGAEVIVHTYLGDSQSEGNAPLPDPHLDNGPALTDAEVAEAECCATTSKVVEDDGVRLWWGRDRRYPTRRLVQLITQRDRTCRHPGCGRTRHLHIHHVKAWSRGGTTDPDNLILLCSTHHRALHRGIFSISAHGKQRFTFHAPDGSVLEPAPPLSITGQWKPNRAVAADATVPVRGGKLNLEYTIEVLYLTWSYRDRQLAAA